MENSLRYIGAELLRAGHEVKIFCLQTSPDQPLRMEHEGIEIIRTPCVPRRWPHTRLREIVRTVQRAIPAVLDEFRPDAVWSRSVPIGLGILRGGYRGPLVHIFCTNAKMDSRGLYLQTHGLPPKRRLMLLGLWPFGYLVSSRLERELARQCTSIAFSENMRRQLLRDFPADARTCHVIPPGVDAEVFSPENGSRYFDRIERDYDLSLHEPIVLYVGRLSCAKHIPMLMDAVRLLKTPAKLVLVGAGPEMTRLKDYARQIGLSDRLVFAGTHHEMLPGFYAMARVCVLPTTTESFGQVYLEAMACGTPCVGFAGDGKRTLTATQEIVLDGKTGAVAKTPNAHALAEGIASVLRQSEAECRTMRRRCREHVVQHFAWRQFVERAVALSYGEERAIPQTSNGATQ